MKPKPFVPEPFEGDGRYVRDRTEDRVWHRCASRTLYADTDRSQVVYHGTYLRYFEFGRASFMRDAGYPYREVEANGYVYPIIEIGVGYFAPLYYDDPIWVYTHPAKMERVRLRFEYVITHRETGEIICKGFTRHCATNGRGFPVGIDEKTRQLWKNFPR
jgi:acyl-CoA thioester hydrolase